MYSFINIFFILDFYYNLEIVVFLEYVYFGCRYFFLLLNLCYYEYYILGEILEKNQCMFMKYDYGNKGLESIERIEEYNLGNKMQEI